MSVKKVIAIVSLLILVAIIVFVAVNLYQIEVIMNEGVAEPVNRDDYTIMSFELLESSGNAMSTEKNNSQSMRLNFETVYIDVPETDGYKKIKLDEETRKSLESDLLALIESHNLKEWDGFDEHLQVMDASNGFSFNLLYANDEELKASGGFAFPDNYGEVFAATKEVFLKYA